VVSICNSLVSERGGRPVWTLAKCGPETSVLLPRDKVTLQRGKLLFLDLGVVVDGYHADFNRMAVVGKASESQSKKCDTIAEITRATLAEVKAGVKACEVVDICRAHFKKHGLEPPPGLVSPDRIGHGMGLTLTEAPAIASYDKTVLREGMTFCLEPAIWTEDGYYITEQDVVVSKEYCAVLSKADDGLYEID
jgi:Xaa-Pro dipeptidase